LDLSVLAFSPTVIGIAARMTGGGVPSHIKPMGVTRDGIVNNGWSISTSKGPIIADRDSDAFR
jgi:hypothetical protein